jgi:hypothetical protein
MEDKHIYTQTDESDLWDGLRYHDMHTRFHKHWFSIQKVETEDT